MTAQDATSTSTPWLESTTTLLSSLLSSSSDTDGGGCIDDIEIENACATILASSTCAATPLPLDVSRIVESVRLRALIKLGRFDDVASTWRRDLGGATVEAAYGLYRAREYEACRKLCVLKLDGGGGGGGSGAAGRGLMHIHAQALYRLGDTAATDNVYRELLSTYASKDVGGSGEERGGVVNTDEREDTLSNALANRIVNHVSRIAMERTDWLEDDADIIHLLETYGRVRPLDEKAKEDGDEHRNAALQNYDLAYNLATYLLITRSARPQLCLAEAMNLLSHAEKSATSIIDDVDDPLLAEQEVNPIRANLALAKLLLGGPTNETEAYRAYLTLCMKLKSSKGGKGKRVAGSTMEGNLLAVSSNNLACLRDGKESLIDVLKRVPTTSRSSVVDETGEDASATITPLVEATQDQARVALFNRALLYAKMGNVPRCNETLDVLRASLRVSYHGGESEKTDSNEVHPLPKDNTKKKKNKRGIPSVADAGGKSVVGVRNGDVLSAKPGSHVEIIAWEARADLLESELHRISEASSSSSTSNDILDAAIAKLDAAITSSSSDDGVAVGGGSGGALPFAKSQLLLHKMAISNASPVAVITMLESLPLSVRSCPGAIVTLASLYDDVGSVEGVLSALGDDRRAKLAMAEFCTERGQYQVAVDLLLDIVDGENDGDSMETTAMLVKALSYTDTSKAIEYASLLQGSMEGEKTGSELSGETLEFMDIPRFAKLASLESSVEGASTIRKLIAATSGKGRSNTGERKSKTRESILRKRSKQRTAYLSRLELEGKYDTSKSSPAMPDPERWIPKNQRSYNRRGRGKYKSNVGAQGGGAGPGMDRDAAKLDVAARVAATKLGSDRGDGGGPKQPSTANIKVTMSTVVRKGKGGKRR